ncbi:MAG: RCC1 domain-containing protein [Acidimicrobiales bacterium]
MRRRSPVAAASIAIAGVLAATSSAAATPFTHLSPLTRLKSASGARGNAAAGATVVYTFGVVGGDGKMRQLEHSVPTPVSGLPGDVVQVATSNSDSYALTAQGMVWAWGAGGLGELGDGQAPRFAGSPVQVRFPPRVRISALANPMPYNSGLAIDSHGHAWGWGYNPEDALCLPGIPVLQPERLPLPDVSLATGAGDHSLFYSEGKVYACGLGWAGELGNGAMRSSPGPTAVAGLPPGRVKALVSSWQGSGALMGSGSYYDWGFNREGQLGDGTTADRDVPVHVSLPAPVTQVSQGGSNAANGQTLALLANGLVWTWGAGELGQLGNGRLGGSAVPVPLTLPSGVHFVQVCSGGDTNYAIDTLGRLWAWGGNGFGQVGNGTIGMPHLRAVPVGVALSQISATATNVVGLSEGLPL